MKKDAKTKRKEPLMTPLAMKKNLNDFLKRLNGPFLPDVGSVATTLFF